MDFLILSGTAILILIVSLLTFYKKKFKHWEERNIPYKQPTIPFGTIGGVISQHASPGEIFLNDYNETKKAGLKHRGFFLFYQPLYMPVDVEIIKNILTKDFHHFVDRGFYHNSVDDPLNANLVTMEGNNWRNLRAKLTPTFTSGRMKLMFGILLESVENLKSTIDEMSLNKEPVDIKDVLGRYTTDVIGSCAFGLDCNSFKNPNSEFREYGKKVLSESKLLKLKRLFVLANKDAARKMRLKLIATDVESFFMKVVKDTVDYREKNNVKRNDFLQLLMELKNDSHASNDSKQTMKSLTIEEVAGQAFIFFLAGFETSSTTMTFCLYELALNPEIQELAREEINDVLEKQDGQLTYDCMMELKYLKQVIDETLRKYPPVPILHRWCQQDYKIPNSDGLISKNTQLFIPVLGLHRDPDYFPEPEKFDPERFSVENKHKIKPFTYLPFGDGPRACIGLRFGLMQAQVGLIYLLKNFSFSLNEKTKSPLEMDPRSFILSALGNIWLNAEKL